jgi:hypothetical protein
MIRDPWSTSSLQSAGFSARQSLSAYRLRVALGWLVDPQVWLRAGLIASLRERSHLATLGALNVQGLFEDRRTQVRCDMVRPTNGGTRDERLDLAPASTALGSRPALGAVADGTPSSQGLSSGTLQAAEPGLDRSALCGGPRKGRTEGQRHPPSRRLTSRHLRQRVYLLLANWIVRGAHALAMRGLLGPATARAALRWSASLSKRSLAIWRSDRMPMKTNHN